MSEVIKVRVGGGVHYSTNQGQIVLFKVVTPEGGVIGGRGRRALGKDRENRPY